MPTEETNEKSWFKKLFWPIFLSLTLSSLLFYILIVFGLFGIFSLFGDDTMELEPNTILHLKLDGPIRESSNVELDPMSFNLNSQTGLADIIFGLEKASSDVNVRGLFIDFGDVDCGMATAKELRDAILAFQKSGKFVLAYNSGEYISQKAYYISSVADEVYAFPKSVFEWKGLGGEVQFFKGLLDKLDVDIEIVRGSDNDFKSAVEPFYRKTMSDSSRIQTERYLSSMWSMYLSEIEKTTQINKDTLDAYAEVLRIRGASDAHDLGLIDGLKYRDEIEKILMKKTKVSKSADLLFFDFDTYCKRSFIEDQNVAEFSDSQIAVVVAAGDISVDGQGMSSTKICNYLSKVRGDENIKAVVFRVNSPGGSALASEEIWREVELTNKIKPIIVSMGDLAASGGYYVAAPATRIFASPSTITGSIGVFGMIPYTGDMLENKLGITFDYVSTHSHGVLSLNKKLTDEELMIVKEETDEVYQLFLNRVASGRNMELSKVHQIARGRVWTGSDALSIGLVDELGGMKEALLYAKKLIQSKNASVIYYPRIKENGLEVLLRLLEDENSIESKSLLHHPLLNDMDKNIRRIEEMKGIQMRMPYDIKIN